MSLATQVLPESLIRDVPSEGRLDLGRSGLLAERAGGLPRIRDIVGEKKKPSTITQLVRQKRRTGSVQGAASAQQGGRGQAQQPVGQESGSRHSASVLADRKRAKAAEAGRADQDDGDEIEGYLGGKVGPSKTDQSRDRVKKAGESLQARQKEKFSAGIQQRISDKEASDQRKAELKAKAGEWLGKAKGAAGKAAGAAAGAAGSALKATGKALGKAGSTAAGAAGGAARELVGAPQRGETPEQAAKRRELTGDQKKPDQQKPADQKKQGQDQQQKPVDSKQGQQQSQQQRKMNPDPKAQARPDDPASHHQAPIHGGGTATVTKTHNGPVHGALKPSDTHGAGVFQDESGRLFAPAGHPVHQTGGHSAAPAAAPAPAAPAAAAPAAVPPAQAPGTAAQDAVAQWQAQQQQQAQQPAAQPQAQGGESLFSKVMGGVKTAARGAFAGADAARDRQAAAEQPAAPAEPKTATAAGAPPQVKVEPKPEAQPAAAEPEQQAAPEVKVTPKETAKPAAEAPKTAEAPSVPPQVKATPKEQPAAEEPKPEAEAEPAKAEKPEAEAEKKPAEGERTLADRALKDKSEREKQSELTTGPEGEEVAQAQEKGKEQARQDRAEKLGKGGEEFLKGQAEKGAEVPKGRSTTDEVKKVADQAKPAEPRTPEAAKPEDEKAKSPEAPEAAEPKTDAEKVAAMDQSKIAKRVRAEPEAARPAETKTQGSEIGGEKLTQASAKAKATAASAEKIDVGSLKTAKNLSSHARTKATHSEIASSEDPEHQAAHKAWAGLKEKLLGRKNRAEKQALREKIGMTRHQLGKMDNAAHTAARKEVGPNASSKDLNDAYARHLKTMVHDLSREHDLGLHPEDEPAAQGAEGDQAAEPRTMSAKDAAMSAAGQAAKGIASRAKIPSGMSERGAKDFLMRQMGQTGEGGAAAWPSATRERAKQREKEGEKLVASYNPPIETLLQEWV